MSFFSLLDMARYQVHSFGVWRRSEGRTSPPVHLFVHSTLGSSRQLCSSRRRVLYDVVRVFTAYTSASSPQLKVGRLAFPPVNDRHMVNSWIHQSGEDGIDIFHLVSTTQVRQTPIFDMTAGVK